MNTSRPQYRIASGMVFGSRSRSLWLGMVNVCLPLPAVQFPMKHYTLPIIIERDAEGFYVSCPPLQGCYSQGDTYDEALSNIKDAIRLHLEDRQADHEELAEPKSFSLSTVEISV